MKLLCIIKVKRSFTLKHVHDISSKKTINYINKSADFADDKCYIKRRNRVYYHYLFIIQYEYFNYLFNGRVSCCSC